MKANELVHPPLVRRSLAAQSVLLAITVTVAAALLVGLATARWMEVRLTRDLDRRGASLAAMLERNKDLHAAALQRDAEDAEQVLQSIVTNDLEMEYAALLDPKGTVLAAAARDLADPSAVVRSQLRNHPLDTPGLANSDRRIRRFTQAVAADQGEKGIWAGSDERLYAPGTTIGYVLLGMRARAASLAQQHTAVTVAGVGVALALSFLVFFLALTRRLRRILVFAERLAAQDLLANLADSSPDEVGRVAAALRSIRERTRGVVVDLAGAAGALRGSSAEIHESAQAQRGRAEAQARRIADISSSVVELERSSRLARDGAEVVIQSGERSCQDAERGKSSVAETMGAVVELRRDVARTVDVLQQLARQNAEIDDIVEMVADLADNSQILGINTGIEAARTGADGEAFRVVAREMQDLADRSKRGTERVREMLSEIARLAETSRATAASGHERVETAGRHARRATEMIERMAAAFSAFVAEAGRIAGNAGEQARAVEAISMSIDEVRGEAEQVAAGSSVMERAAQDVLARAERLNAAMAGYRVEARGRVG